MVDFAYENTTNYEDFILTINDLLDLFYRS